ncbi:uncharacterized protein LOC112589954 isoform X2 [Harpegnathos saltator]|uniref:uncharacterized protein LOC112589954 isoform X2 n=1 Tax=Harpegnathos saltator TaxID=610380 RepID=UPI000DBED97B|nr:uncharacterized protein LOC112589954 isoform X2 [Harpegnathos saltator]
MGKQCCVRNCNMKWKSKSGVHLFGFPLKDENRLHKWIAVVKKPNWKPTKNSKIYAVPRGQSSNNEENEQCNTLLNVKEVFNIENSKTSILTDSIDHNYIDNEAAIKNINLMELSHTPVEKGVIHLNTKQIAVEMKPGEYSIISDTQRSNSISNSTIRSNSINTDSEEETSIEETVQSKSLKKLQNENRTLKWKLQRRDKKISSMETMLNELQQKQIMDNDSL